MREKVFKLCVRLARVLLFPFEKPRAHIPHSYIPKSLDNLVANHFVEHSDPTHVNRVGLTLALRHLESRPALIVETGSSAWGTNSSLLFDSYVREFGGVFVTVDIREEAASDLRPKLSKFSQAYIGDSVEFLEELKLPDDFSSISLVYLDSFDLDLDDPEPAMQHGLSEFNAVHPLLGTGSILVVDDTPIDPSLFGKESQEFRHDDDFVPGKGALILRSPLIAQYDVLYHHYNLVLKRKWLCSPCSRGGCPQGFGAATPSRPRLTALA